MSLWVLDTDHVSLLLERHPHVPYQKMLRGLIDTYVKEY